MPDIKRWSDLKLDKELAFARGALDPNDDRTLAWLTKLQVEAVRRLSARAA